MSDIEPTSDVPALTVQLLSAYLANNTVASEQLAELIRSTRAALSDDGAPSGEPSPPEVFTGAVSVRKSLASPEHIISLIDGKPYKTLKRHLASRGLTPDAYRSRYNLPASYPMVAPAYADHRRAVAHRLGLGRKATGPGQGAEQEGPVPVDGPDTQASREPNVMEVAAEQPKKAPAKSAPRRGRKKATVADHASPAGTTASAASAANASEGAAEPAADATPEVARVRTPGEAHRASTEKTPAPKGSKPRGKTAKAALEGAKPDAPDTAVEGKSDISKSKPGRRRGKISLFKGSSDEAGRSADGLDTAEGSAADAGQVPSAPEPKARVPKRMARPPKSEAT